MPLSRKPRVMVSSTRLDLVEYRKEAINVLITAGYDVQGSMEFLTAEEEPPVAISENLVDQAELFIGIYAWRYGTFAPGRGISITEAEYDRTETPENAGRIKRRLFIVDRDHPPKSMSVVDFENHAQLTALKNRVSAPDQNTVATFTTVDNFSMLLGQALQKLTWPELETGAGGDERVRDQEEIAAYLERLRLETGDIGLFGLGRSLKLRLPIREIFVDLGTRAVHGLEDTRFAHFHHAEAADQVEHLDDSVPWNEMLRRTLSSSEATRKRAVCILGDPGSGKTTLVRKLAWELASTATSPEVFGLPAGTVPVLLRFRDLKAADLDTWGPDLLKNWVERDTRGKAGGAPGTGLYRRGKVLWILDGLDEIVSEDARKQVLDFLEAAVDERFARGDRFVVTSRFSGVEGKAEVPAVFQEFHVKPLPREEIPVFVRRWFRAAIAALKLPETQAETESDELLKVLDGADYKIGRLRSLCHNPLMLTILCVVYHQDSRLPHGRAELYSHCIDVLVDHWLRSKQAPGEALFDPQKARALLRTLAWYLHGTEGRTHAPAPELSEQIEPVLAEYNDPRLGRDGLAFIERMRNECGILVGAGGGNVGFLHLTFQEYLAADRAVEEGRVQEVARAAAGPWWRETALLTARIARKNTSAQFFTALLQLNLQDEDTAAVVRQCMEESIEFPPEPFIARLDGGATPEEELALLHCLQARETLPLPLLDALGRRAGESWNPETMPALSSLLLRGGRSSPYEGGPQMCIHEPSDLTFVWIEPGSFVMGEPDGLTWHEFPAPLHEVSLTRGFWMAATPVTNRHYARFLEAHPGREVPKFWNDSQWNGERQPVVGVSWEEARAFAEWLGGCLPTEAQWEYACRAGSPTRYCFGNEEERLAEYAWYDANSEGRTRDVGTLKPNAWGLHDLHGNVWEWCADWAGPYETESGPTTDPTGPSHGGDRVLRGGSWLIVASRCASGYRGGLRPSIRDQGLGFRVVLPPSPAGPSEKSDGGAAGDSGTDPRREGRDDPGGAEPAPNPRRGWFGWGKK